MGLVTTSEATAALTDLDSAQTLELQSVIDGATALMESYCGRILASRETCEERDPGATRIIRLRNYPVTSVARVAGTAASVLTIAYTGPASRATATLAASGNPPFVAPTGLTIASISSGVQTQTTLAFGTIMGQYATVAALATAINAISGWTASPVAGYETFATVDLQADLSVRSAKNATLPIFAYATDLNDWAIDPPTGEIRLNATYSARFRSPDRTWGVGARSGLVWVRYTAGYVNAPADLKRACIAVVRGLFDAEMHSGVIKSETVGTDRWEMFDPNAKGSLGVLAPVAGTLNRYVRVTLD